MAQDRIIRRVGTGQDYKKNTSILGYMGLLNRDYRVGTGQDYNMKNVQSRTYQAG